MSINILITGGTGLIGQSFIKRFREYHYTVLTRSIFKSEGLLPSTVKLIDSLDALENLDNFDAVINLAGEPIIDKRWSEQQKTIISESRWLVTQKLVDLFALSQNPPKVFLSGSAIGVYGNRGSEVLTESSLVKKSDFSSTLCLRWEQIAKQAEPFTRVVLLRTGIVLAQQGGALAKMLLPFKCGVGGRIGNGQQYMSWIHYQDYINAMHFLLAESHLSSAVNVVAPEAATNRLFTQSLAAVLRRPAFIPVPKFMLRLVLGESSSLLLDSQRVSPQALLDSGFNFQFENIQVALTNLLNKPLSKEDE